MLPMGLPNDFCFGGGQNVPFVQVDWFGPCNPLDYMENKVKDFEEYKPDIIEFIKQKNYYNPDRCYVVMTRFGESFMFGENII